MWLTLALTLPVLLVSLLAQRAYGGGVIDASPHMDSNYVDSSWNISADGNASTGIFIAFTEFEVESHTMWGLGCFDKVTIRRPNGLAIQLCGTFESNPGSNFTVFTNSLNSSSTYVRQSPVSPTKVFYFPDPWVSVNLKSDSSVPSYFKAIYYSGNFFFVCV